MSKSHPLEIPVDNPLAMDVDQPHSNISQLDKSSDNQWTRSEEGEILNRKPTSLNRSASGCAFTKSLMFPFTIQSDIIAN